MRVRGLVGAVLVAAVAAGSAGSSGAAGWADPTTPANPTMLMSAIPGRPGRSPVASQFHDPHLLASWGFTHVAYSAVETAATYSWLPATSRPVFSAPAEAWRASMAAGLQLQLEDAAAAGLRPLCQMDMFVLPSDLFAQHADQLIDPSTGLISLSRSFTRTVISGLLGEVFEHFPLLAGLVIRVGELSLLDYPYHNVKPRSHPPATLTLRATTTPPPSPARLLPSPPPTHLRYSYWQGTYAVDHDAPIDISQQQKQYVALLQFLREEVAVKRNRTLVFRTWDTAGFTPDDPPRMHGNQSYYVAVTDQIEPHPSMYFSIKHTMLDFWRRVRFNPTIGIGHHAQVVEAEMAREYEGNGAYPNYVAGGLIEGFPEFAGTETAGQGLATAMASPGSVVRGVWTWARGGGWYGPYVLSELSPALNVFVVSQWFRAKIERRTPPAPAALVDRFVTEIAQLPTNAAGLFAAIADNSTLAVLEMHYSAAADEPLHGLLVRPKHRRYFAGEVF
eukprot:COSAG04_NODE_343_length_16235_cov_7.800570_2_plen_504_part_00